MGSKLSLKKLSPIVCLFFNSIIPSLSSERFSSDSEQSIPKDSTPLILATESFIPFFGITVPGEAYTVVNPSLALEAPQTTLVIFPSPISTSQIFNLSASGCLIALIILQTLKLDKLLLAELMLSTSKPIDVNFSAICSVVDFVLKYFFNQANVIFILPNLYNYLAHRLH